MYPSRRAGLCYFYMTGYGDKPFGINEYPSRQAGIGASYGLPWQLPDGNCLLIASGSLHPSAVWRSQTAKRGACAPASIPPSGIVLFLHTAEEWVDELEQSFHPAERDCVISTWVSATSYTGWVINAFHPAERDCVISTWVSATSYTGWVINAFPSRRAGLCYFYSASFPKNGLFWVFCASNPPFGGRFGPLLP